MIAGISIAGTSIEAAGRTRMPRDAARRPLGDRTRHVPQPPLGVILTGGRATRLRPLSDAMPKSLIPLLNRPLIAYAMESLAAAGLTEIVVVVGPTDERTGPAAIEAAPPGVTVTVAVQREPKGSGDALTSVGDALDGRHVAVAAVDAILRGDLRPHVDAFMASGYDAWLVLHETDRPREMGIVVIEGDRVTHLEEKPAEPRSNLALVGIWMVAPDVVAEMRREPLVSPRGEVELSGTLAVMHEHGRPIGGSVFAGDWLDAGTLASLLVAQGVLLRAWQRLPGAGKREGAPLLLEQAGDRPRRAVGDLVERTVDRGQRRRTDALSGRRIARPEGGGNPAPREQGTLVDARLQLGSRAMRPHPAEVVRQHEHHAQFRAPVGRQPSQARLRFSHRAGRHVLRLDGEEGVKGVRDVVAGHGVEAGERHEPVLFALADQADVGVEARVIARHVIETPEHAEHGDEGEPHGQPTLPASLKTPHRESHEGSKLSARHSEAYLRHGR